MSYGGKGMYMPTQKDGKNWEITFSITVLKDGAGMKAGDRIENRTKGFRVRQNALEWIKDIKSRSFETAQCKPEYVVYRDFTYTQPKQIK